MHVAESEARAAFDVYFQALSRPGVTADDMLAEAVTDDFETGFAGGFRWQEPDGLREFLDARAGFVDERHDVRRSWQSGTRPRWRPACGRVSSSRYASQTPGRC